MGYKRLEWTAQFQNRILYKKPLSKAICVKRTIFQKKFDILFKIV